MQVGKRKDIRKTLLTNDKDQDHLIWRQFLKQGKFRFKLQRQLKEESKTDTIRFTIYKKVII